MTSGLEDLFVQILHSEQKARERRSLLIEVKQDVTDCQSQIEEVQEEQKCIQGQIISDLQRWNDVELNLKCAAFKETNLKSQLETLRKRYEALERKLQQSKDGLLKLHDTFCADVKSFMTNFDLLSFSNHHRDVSIMEEIQELNQKKEKLQKQLSTYSLHQKEVDSLEKEINNIQTKIKANQRQANEIKKAIDKEKSWTRIKEQKREKVSNTPQTSQDYIRLRAELVQYREDRLEDYCSALQSELQTLQQKLWQKNLRKQPKKTAEVSHLPQKRYSSYGCTVPKTTTNSKAT